MPDSVMRHIGLSTAILAIVAGLASAADTVTSYDGTTIHGAVLRLREGQLEVATDGDQQPRKLALGNLTAVKLVPPPPDPAKFGSQLLINNDGFHGPTEKIGTVKLRKGLHGFTLLYFQGGQGATLDLLWSGPGIKKQKIPRNVLSKWKNTSADVTYSDGLDEEGFRKPDQVDETLAQVGYKLFEWSEGNRVSEVGDLRDLAIKKYGTVRDIGLNFPHTPTNFGAVYYWLLNVPKDGEYTFYLNCDDGGQLYVGKFPPISQPTIRTPAPDQWRIELEDNAQLNLPLAGWDEAGLQCTMKAGGKELELKIPKAHLREVWKREFADNPAALDRSGEPKDADTVYAKNADNQIQRVSGTVLGIAEGALQLDYQGTERTISLERVAAVILNGEESADRLPAKRIAIRFDLCGPDQLVGHLTTLTPGRAVIELPWGQELSLSRNMIYRMIILNGRMQSLQDLSPAQTVETPFLDHIHHWQAGKSLTGSSLRIGETTYQKGIALHSRTQLTWDLAGDYERFQADVGLQHPEGQLGNALVRVLADGEELFVTEELTADDGPQSLDLDVGGREQLTLEVDFGHNMHIGDHVIFGNARLLRPELTP